MALFAQFRIDASKHVARKTGGSAVRVSAYRAGERLIDERTGEIHDFSRRKGVVHSEIVMPDTGGPEWTRGQLWNAAEVAENRKDGRVARKVEMSLPCDATAEQREEIARAWAKELANTYGVAVDFAIHLPDKDGDQRNHHVHLMMTTRQITPEGLAGKAPLELSNSDQAKRGLLTGREAIWDMRERAAEVFNRTCKSLRLDMYADPRSYAEQGLELTPTKHIGVHAKAMERKGIKAERIDLFNAERQEQAEQIKDRPEVILDKITATQAVFSRHDIARELNRYIDDTDQFQTLLTKLEESSLLVQLAPEETDGGRTFPARYSTRDMIEAEQRMVDAAEALAGRQSHGVEETKVKVAIERAGTVTDEQRQAVEHVTKAGQIAAIIGDAGTGKSFSMRVAKEAWEADGYRVRGAALAGKAADELQAGSGIGSRTIASLEYAWKVGRDNLTSRDVLVIDEAGMIGSRQLGRVLETAQKAGAKVVLLGDDKQLAAIEAGAAFRAVIERVGAAEITEIRRQREGWAREASQHLARGSVQAGLHAYAERGYIKMHDTREGARDELARAWMTDHGKGSAIILAHSNRDVQALNAAVRDARKERGELVGETRFQTERDGRDFAAGDRIVFLRNDSGLAVKNGTLGTIEQARANLLGVRLDDGSFREVRQNSYAAIDHGYAVTVHKAQGVTVDRAYVLATPGMDRSLAYVAMTRHRDAVTLIGGRDDFASYKKMVHVLARQRPKESTLDFADRRGFDGESVLRRWIDRGRTILNDLANRAREAMRSALEKSGHPTDTVLAVPDAVRQAFPLQAPEGDVAKDRPGGSTTQQPTAAAVNDQEHRRIEVAAKQLVSQFSTLCIKRRMKANGYTDEGSEWTSLSNEEREQVERFNALPKERQEAELDTMRKASMERFTRDPKAIERDRQKHRQRDRERGRDRGR